MKCHIPKTERKHMPAKLSFTYEGKILSQTKAEGFHYHSTHLEEMLKEVLQAEMKTH